MKSIGTRYDQQQPGKPSTPCDLWNRQRCNGYPDVHVHGRCMHHVDSLEAIPPVLAAWALSIFRRPSGPMAVPGNRAYRATPDAKLKCHPGASGIVKVVYWSAWVVPI